MLKYPFCILAFFPILSFGIPQVESAQNYVDDLQQNITQEMQQCAQDVNNIPSDERSISLQAPMAKKSDIAGTSRGNLGQYFRTIEEKKHPMVDFYIRYYTTFGKRALQDSLVRLQKYFPMIFDRIKEKQLPLEAILLPIVESDANISDMRNGRAGLWMLSKSTAQIYGLSMTDYNDERFDVLKSTDTALSYFSSLCQAFNGDWDLALTSFNGGGIFIQKTMRDIGSQDFWSLLNKDFASDIPTDTLEYVPKFYAILTILKHPNSYNISVPQLDESTTKVTRISLGKSGVSFGDIAKLTNIDVDELNRLNPHLRRDYTVKGANLYVPSNTEYLTKSRIQVARAVSLRYLPYGTTSATRNLYSIRSAGRLAKAKHSYTTSGRTIQYTVRAKDTLYSLAKRYNISVDTLRKQNHIKNDFLKAGQVILIAKTSPQRGVRFTKSRQFHKKTMLAKNIRSRVGGYGSL